MRKMFYLLSLPVIISYVKARGGGGGSGGASAAIDPNVEIPEGFEFHVPQ